MRYIIRTRNEAAALAAFLDSISTDPDIVVADRIGPAGQEHTAVLDVADRIAPQFEELLGDSEQLMIERDRPLSMDH